jgi:hypothetical protein
LSDYEAPLMRKKTFLRTSEGAIASFSWDDVDEGIGYINYLAGQVNMSGAAGYALLKDEFNPFAENVDTQYEGNCIRVSTTSTSYTKLIEIDFETPSLNFPKILNGVMICEIPLNWTNLTSGQNAQIYAVVDLNKVDADDTETLITTGISGTLSRGVYGGGPSYTYPVQYYITFPISVPNTKLKRNEYIRTTLKIYAKTASASYASGIILCYDPYNRAIAALDASGTVTERLTGAEGYTQMKFKIPFKIEV